MQRHSRDRPAAALVFTNNIEPDIETLIRLADIFNTSVDYLIGYSEINHRLEKLSACDLNEEELWLVQQYRRLSPRRRRSIAQLADAMLEE